MQKKPAMSEKRPELPPRNNDAVQLPLQNQIGLIRRGIWVRYPPAEKMKEYLERFDIQHESLQMMGKTLICPIDNGISSLISHFQDTQLVKRKRMGDLT